VVETDPYGNFLLSGFDTGTARNWARSDCCTSRTASGRAGLLPEGWRSCEHGRRPGKSRCTAAYLVNGEGVWPITLGAYFANGRRRSATVIIPTHDLVVCAWAARATAPHEYAESRSRS